MPRRKLPAAGLAADPPFKITSADGTSSLTFGFLVQPQLEVQKTADGADTLPAMSTVFAVKSYVPGA